jgi:DNA-binding NarL/FixJ family response regulator
MRTRAQTKEGKIAVCVVERNPLAAHYLRSVLGRDDHLEVLSERNTLSTPRACEIPTPIFVVDTGTLSCALVTYLTVVRSRFHDARILLLGSEPSADELRRLPLLGVKGFVPYHDVKHRLSLALQTISHGDSWFAPELLDEFAAYSKSLRSRGQSGGKRRGMFTPREELVVGLLNRRLGNKEIASALGISERTVRFHLVNVFRKLGVHDRQSAADVTRSRRRP